MGHCAPHAIKFPNYKNITLAAELYRFVQAWPLGPGAAGNIGKQFFTACF
jgi:hypothetical protein